MSLSTWFSSDVYVSVNIPIPICSSWCACGYVCTCVYVCVRVHYYRFLLQWLIPLAPTEAFGGSVEEPEVEKTIHCAC